MIPIGLAALKQYPQFIVYRIELDATTGKLNKIPAVSVTDPSRWMSHDAAYQFANQHPGKLFVGFVLRPELSRIAVVDVDGCRDQDTGKLSDLALTMIAMLPGAYVEVSISGTGIHIWFSYRGDMLPHVCRAKGLEFYHTERFFALGTEYVAEGFINGSVEMDLTAILPLLIAAYFPPVPPSASGEMQEWTDGPCEEWNGPADDRELLRRALNSRSSASAFDGNASFADLWFANEPVLAASYPDPNERSYDASAADAALAQHLAFWTGRDCERIDRLMRENKLARDKWDTHKTYLRELTILRAVGRQTEVLQERRPPATVAAPAVGGITLTPIERTLANVGTQDAVALIFTQRMKGKMLYDRTRNSWMDYDGTRWRKDQWGKAYNLIRDISRELNYEGKASMGAASFCEGVDRHLQSAPEFARTTDQFDLYNYLLNTPAGTFDLRTCKMRPHDPTDFITLCTAAAPEPLGGESFMQFMREITLNDLDLIQFHQVSLGACLSGAVESHWMLFWIGGGRNGKNTLGDLVQDAMGDYARKVPASTLMARSFDGHPTDIANLQGLRLATSSEINDGDHWNEALINEVTGDATLSARFMRGDYFEFQRTHKHLIYGNYKPQLRSVSDGIRSRIKIVPFNASFKGRENADLPRLLREHLGYVLLWLMEGHRKWLVNGKQLPNCEAVEAESNQYFENQSTPQLWLAERTERVEKDDRPSLQFSKVGDLYRDYKQWKEARSERAVSLTRWLEVLRGFEKVRSQLGTHYRGLRLRPLQYGEVPFPPMPLPTLPSLAFTNGPMTSNQ